MADVTLKALKDFSYLTRRLKAGDSFTVPAPMAKVLVAIKKAEAHREPGRVPAPPARVVRQAQAATPARDATSDDFLDRSIPAVAKDLPGLSVEDIRKHLSAEKRGKSRKGLIVAFEAELEARKA
jgi:hypothetical protein